MAKAGKKHSAKPNATLGRTFDGIDILRPKTASTKFTPEQIRAAIEQVMRPVETRTAAHGPRAGDIFVERRANGVYAVRKHGAARASAILPTQKEAIRRARELVPDRSPLIERTRHTGAVGKWRRV